MVAEKVTGAQYSDIESSGQSSAKNSQAIESPQDAPKEIDSLPFILFYRAFAREGTEVDYCILCTDKAKNNRRNFFLGTSLHVVLIVIDLLEIRKRSLLLSAEGFGNLSAVNVKDADQNDTAQNACYYFNDCSGAQTGR